VERSSSWNGNNARAASRSCVLAIFAIGQANFLAEPLIAKNSDSDGKINSAVAGTVAVRNPEHESGSHSGSKLLLRNQPAERFVDNVELQLLNKVTGKVHQIKAKIGKTVTFERLQIILLKCWKSFPEENPENKLLLKIFETNQHSGLKKLIFYGWILSSTPSVSGLEHPLYDVELKNCM
jgi:hypothetical protein